MYSSISMYTAVKTTFESTVPLYNRKFLYFASLYIRLYRQVLHFCMWNFVSADKADWALSVETQFHQQKYDGLENIEKRSGAVLWVL